MMTPTEWLQCFPLEDQLEEDRACIIAALEELAAIPRLRAAFDDLVHDKDQAMAELRREKELRKQDQAELAVQRERVQALTELLAQADAKGAE